LTRLEEAFDPPLSSLPFDVPLFSSTLMDTIVSDLTLLTSLLPLAQCTGLVMGEISRGDASDIKDDSFGWLKELTLVEPYLEEPSFEELCGDIVMGSATPSIERTDSICFKPLDLTLTSCPSLPTNPSHLHAFHESLGYIR